MQSVLLLQSNEHHTTNPTRASPPPTIFLHHNGGFGAWIFFTLQSIWLYISLVSFNIIRPTQFNAKHHHSHLLPPFLLPPLWHFSRSIFQNIWIHTDNTNITNYAAIMTHLKYRYHPWIHHICNRCEWCWPPISSHPILTKLPSRPHPFPPIPLPSNRIQNHLATG